MFPSLGITIVYEFTNNANLFVIILVDNLYIYEYKSI